MNTSNQSTFHNIHSPAHTRTHRNTFNRNERKRIRLELEFFLSQSYAINCVRLRPKWTQEYTRRTAYWTMMVYTYFSSIEYLEWCVCAAQLIRLLLNSLLDYFLLLFLFLSLSLVASVSLLFSKIFFWLFSNIWQPAAAFKVTKKQVYFFFRLLFTSSTSEKKYAFEFYTQQCFCLSRCFNSLLFWIRTK